MILRVFFCRKVRTSCAALEISQEEMAGQQQFFLNVLNFRTLHNYDLIIS